MDVQEKAQVLEEMKQKIEALKETISSLQEETKPMGLDSAVGRVSRMDYINNKSVREAQLNKAKSDLLALERWMSLENHSSFGKCSRCGNKINPKRLLFMPSATHCIRCAL